MSRVSHHVLLILCACLQNVLCDKNVAQLLENLLSDYNRVVRPVHNASDALKVKFGANLCRLIDVDEVNQVLTTSLWLEMQWVDRKLMWTPTEWGGVETVHIPSDQIWIPDIVLYNNADGEPHITISSLARVDFRGRVVWQPPSIYKSFCPINIKYFPYDWQECVMKFGGWTNDGETLDLDQIPVNVEDTPIQKTDDAGVEYLFLERGLGLSFYHESAEWDLLGTTSSRYAQIYPGCCGQQYYIDIKYKIVIRRKAIFFTVMLTIPCMLIANLTPFVFMILPNEHKMTYSISVFVAFTVFYLVLIELIPPTSVSLSLIGVYLLFTLLMVAASIVISVVTINIYRRQAFASEMSDWQRWLFVQWLPKYLNLKSLDNDCDKSSDSGTTTPRTDSVSVVHKNSAVTNSPVFPTQRLRLLSLVQMDEALKRRCVADNLDLFRKIFGHLKIIAAHFHNQQLESRITDEWQLMSLVIDRVFLILYLVINITANILFFYNAPTLFDQRPSLTQTIAHKPLSGDSVNVVHF
ncbi:unnamed protein product [Caenorhabditis auriculariae]|uniref:Uncharacterized protein n=1 Tax=Caenorhabditis auriculariae TaxID=2777116 RepID=A0A8S1GUX4_9PELO|nr:unnamed protein product [Caenorhabditis auriculariae]